MDKLVYVETVICFEEIFIDTYSRRPRPPDVPDGIMSPLLCGALCCRLRRSAAGPIPRVGKTVDPSLERLHRTLSEQLFGALDEASVGGHR